MVIFQAICPEFPSSWKVQKNTLKRCKNEVPVTEIILVKGLRNCGKEGVETNTRKERSD